MHFVTYLAILGTCLQTLECQIERQRALNSRLNFFDIDLLRYSVEDKKGNVMVSPVSIRNTLAMLLEGAVGETAIEIRTALRLSPVKEDQRTELKQYLSTLQDDSTTGVVEHANALFVNDKLKIKKEYENVVKNIYKSEISNIDFNNPKKVAKDLNEWVNKKTKGYIPAIIQPDQIEPTTEMLVANALYFKGMWKHGFNLRNRGTCFFTYGTCNKVKMMELDVVLNYVYVSNLRAHAVELPYQGDRYSMILLIPQDRIGVSSLVRDLPYMSLPQISELMEPTEIRLSMPKFTVSYGEDMAATLRNMRVRTLFEPNANLSDIFESTTPHVTTIFHKVYMEVDENGTIAAAATVAHVVPLINSGVELRVDRPFVFFIRDNKLGLVLFEGKIEEPAEYIKATEAKTTQAQPPGIFPDNLAEFLKFNES